MTETGNSGPSRPTPSFMVSIFFSLFDVWFIQKNTWAPSGGHPRVSACLILKLKFQLHGTKCLHESGSGNINSKCYFLL